MILLKLQKEIFYDFNIFEAFSNLNVTKENILENNTDEYEIKLNQYKEDLFDNYIKGLEFLIELKNDNITYYYIEFIFKLNIDLYTKRNDLRFNSEYLTNHKNYFNLLTTTINFLSKDNLVVLNEVIRNLNIEDNNQFSEIFNNFKKYLLKIPENKNKEDDNKNFNIESNIDDEDNEEDNEEDNDNEEEIIEDEEDVNDKIKEDKEENEDDEENNNLKGAKINNLIMNFFETTLFINKPQYLHEKVINFLMNIIEIKEFNFKDEIISNNLSLNISFNKEIFKNKIQEFEKLNFEIKNDIVIIDRKSEVIKHIKDIFLSKRNFLKTKFYFNEDSNFNENNNEFNLNLFQKKIYNLWNTKNKNYDENNFNQSIFLKFIRYASEKECLNKSMESILYLFISNTLDYDCFFLFTDINFFKLIIIINELMEYYDNINNNIFNIFNKKSSKTKHYFFEILANFIIFELKILSKYHYKENNDYIKEHIFRITILFKFFQNLCEGNLKVFKEFVREKEILDFFYNLFEYFITFEKIFENTRTMNIDIIYGLIDVISEYISGPNKKNQIKMPDTILKEIIYVIEDFSYEEDLSINNNVDNDTNDIKIEISKLLLSYIESNKNTAYKVKKLININNLYTNIFKTVIKIKKEDKSNSIISDYNFLYTNKLQLIDSYCYSSNFKNRIDLLINLFLLIKYLGKFFEEFKLIEKDIENYNYRDWFINKNPPEINIINTSENIKNKSSNLDKWAFFNSIKKYCENDLKINFHTNYISIIFDFFKQIISNIEIIDENGELLKIYFPKEPMTFYLTDNSKNEFFEESDLSSLKIKQIQIMKDFDIYYMEMNDEFNKNKFNYYLTSTDSFYYYGLLIYILYFSLNIIFLIDYKYNGTTSIILFRYLEIINLLNLISTAITFLFIILWFYSKLKIYYKIELFKFINDNDINKINKFIKLKIFLRSLFLQHKFIPFLIHFILGLLYYLNTFFITVHLFMIIFFNKTMKYIIYGSMKHIDQFLLSLFWAVSIMNTYSILTLNYFTTQISSEINLCENLLHCLFSILTFGLKGRAWSEIFINVDQSNNLYYARFFFDLIFYLLVPVILFNIFTAILIDTFSQLKKESIERKEEWNKICFICGLDTTQLLKYKISFHKHVSRDHNLWRYIYYLTHLKKKGKKEFSSIEYWVYECLEENNTEWIPNEVTKEIFKYSTSKKNNNLDYLEEIDNEINKKLDIEKNKKYNQIKHDIINYISLNKNNIKDTNLKNMIFDLDQEKLELLKDEEYDEEFTNIEEEESEKDINELNDKDFISNSKITGNLIDTINRTKNNSLTNSKFENFKLSLDISKFEGLNSNLNLKPKFEDSTEE